MIKIDRFLGQFSEVLCTALHQWVEVSYVTKWFHHQQNIFHLRITTMIWPNLKDHNSNFLDSSLIAVPFEKKTAHMFNCFPHDDFFQEFAKVWCHLMVLFTRSHVPTKREMEKSSTQKYRLFGGICDRSREGFFGLFGWWKNG